MDNYSKKATKVVNSHGEEASEVELLQASVELFFVPSPLQQQLKAQFWARFEPGPFADKSRLNLPLVQEHVNDPKLKQYWGVPGFKEWFSNKDEAREKLEYLFMLASSAMEQVLLDPGANANAKANIFKNLAEMTGRLTKGGKEADKFSDDQVNKMSEEELRKFIQKKGVTVSAKYSVKPTTEGEETFLSEGAKQ